MQSNSSITQHYFWVLSHLSKCTQPIRCMPLKFRGLQIAVYATVPDSPSSLGRESGTDPRLSMYRQVLIFMPFSTSA